MEEKFYLTMSAVGDGDEIIQALHELLTALESATTLHDIRTVTTYGKGQVLMCTKKCYTK